MAVPKDEDKPARGGARNCEIQDVVTVCLETIGEHEGPAMLWRSESSMTVPDVSMNKAHNALIKGFAEDDRGESTHTGRASANTHTASVS